MSQFQQQFLPQSKAAFAQMLFDAFYVFLW
jgi:hypothetical protein